MGGKAAAARLTWPGHLAPKAQRSRLDAGPDLAEGVGHGQRRHARSGRPLGGHGSGLIGSRLLLRLRVLVRRRPRESAEPIFVLPTISVVEGLLPGTARAAAASPGVPRP